jgi:lipopolysaccharide transport system permease protein
LIILFSRSPSKPTQLKFRALNNNWTEVISPKRGLFDLRLSEIWRYRDLIMLFVKRDFISIYKQTILGPLWLFIQPIFTTITFVIIFARVAKLSTDGVPPLLFYMSGITIWTYFADCLTKTSSTFTANASIFGKVYFPRLVTPISIVLSNIVKFGIQFLMLAIFIVYFVVKENYQFPLSPNLLLIPLVVMLMALLGLGMGIIFSSFTTKYRDMAFLLQFSIQLLMYGSAVIYPLNSVPEKIRNILVYNPIGILIETFKYALLGAGFFSINSLLYVIVFCAVLLLIGIVIFNKVEQTFMDTV